MTFEIGQVVTVDGKPATVKQVYLAPDGATVDGVLVEIDGDERRVSPSDVS